MRPSPRAALLTSATALLASVGVVLTAPDVLAAGSVFGNGSPGFVVSEPDLTLPVGPALQWNHPDQSGEPSIGVNWKSGSAMYMAGNNTLKIDFDPSTSAVTWSDASPYLGTAQNLDPILATDPTSGTTLAGGDTGACSVMFRSTDDGASWLPSLPCSGTTDHPSVGWAPSAVTPGARVWYYCQQQGMQACATSTNDGLTWLPGSADFFLDCESFHGHIRGSADGTTYLPSHTCFDAGSNIRVGGLRTTDDGATWQVYTIPNAPEPASGFDPAVTTTPDNTLYEAWNNAGDYHPVLAVSHDHGDTWGGTIDLASTVSPPILASTFPTLVAGDNGRIAYSFLGTSAGQPGVDPFSSGFHGVWYLYTSYTYDGGQTWTTVRDTPTPVQYGEIDAGGTTTSGQRNLLDFMDSSLTKDGRVVVAFADGCLADCESTGSSGNQAGAEALSTHAWAAVAYQNAGRGLFSAYDVVLPPSAPTLTATSGAGGASLAWSAPTDDGGAAVTSYRVFRDGAQVGTTSALAFVDSEAPRGAHSYTVRAVNSAGPGPTSNAVSASTYTVPGSPVLTVTAAGSDAHLSWTVPDDGGSAITGYVVRRSTSTGAETALTSTGGTSYTDSSLATGQQYYYDVVATNAAGSGAPSAEVAFSNATAPGAPVLAATAGTNQVGLSWTAPSDGGAPITSYVVRRGTAPGTASTYATIGAVTSWVDAAVTPGVTYYYQVQAVNSVGTGASSAEAGATPYTTAGAPVLATTAGKGQVKLTWTQPGNGGTPITGYQIYRGASSGTERLVQTISTGTTYVDATVTGGTTYYYRVAAVTSAGTGSLSNESSATPKKG